MLINRRSPRFLFDPSDPSETSGGYDTAQVCVNGHEINASTRLSPESIEKFCSKCGEETITCCPHCETPIRGHLRGSLAISYTPPKFCNGCGKAFPWTAQAMKAARIYADELKELSPEERETLKRSIDDLVKDTPSTLVAASRFKKLLLKAGPVALQTMSKILSDIITKAAVAAMTGQP